MMNKQGANERSTGILACVPRNGAQAFLPVELNEGDTGILACAPLEKQGVKK